MSMREALEWAIADIEGRANYLGDEQRVACIAKAKAVLASSAPAQPDDVVEQCAIIAQKSGQSFADQDVVERAVHAVAQIEMDREGYPLSRTQEEIYQDAAETVEAAIAAIQPTLDEVREVLEPFALAIKDHVPDDHLIETVAWTAGDLRRAAALHQKLTEAK